MVKWDQAIFFGASKPSIISNTNNLSVHKCVSMTSEDIILTYVIKMCLFMMWFCPHTEDTFPNVAVEAGLFKMSNAWMTHTLTQTHTARKVFGCQTCSETRSNSSDRMTSTPIKTMICSLFSIQLLDQNMLEAEHRSTTSILQIPIKILYSQKRNLADIKMKKLALF